MPNVNQRESPHISGEEIVGVMADIHSLRSQIHSAGLGENVLPIHRQPVEAHTKAVLDAREAFENRIGHAIVITAADNPSSNPIIKRRMSIRVLRSSHLKPLTEISGIFEGAGALPGSISITHEKNRGSRAGGYDVRVIDPDTNQPAVSIDFPEPDTTNVVYLSTPN